MEPKYFVENRYSIVVDVLPTLKAADYALADPETAFEQSVQHDLAEANWLLMNGKFRTALEKYDHLRGRIATVINPKLGHLGGMKVDWSIIRVAEYVPSIIAKSASILEQTSFVDAEIAKAWIGDNVTLSQDVAEKFAPYESAGIKGSDDDVGFLLDEGQRLVELKEFGSAAAVFGEATSQTTDKVLRAALLHDKALMEEKSGNQTAALATMTLAKRTMPGSSRAETKVSILLSMSSMQERAGQTTAARSTLKEAETLSNKFNAGTLLTRSAVAVSAPAGISRTLAPLPSRRGGGRTLLLRPGMEAVPALAGLASTSRSNTIGQKQPQVLLSSAAYTHRKSRTTLTILDSKGKANKILINNSSVANLTKFYETLKKTTDVGLLSGYLGGHAVTVAYLAHIHAWVIPMAMADCYAALGSYEKAEELYLSTLDYPYLNKLVGAVNLWISLAELYNDWGDRLYRQARNDIARFPEAEEKYQQLMLLANTLPVDSPLYQHTNFSLMKTRAKKVVEEMFGAGVSFKENPRIIIALATARVRLTQISNGLNFLGISVAVPPFSFEHLQNLARYFVQHAAQVEQMYIQFKSSGENETLREQQMEQQAAVASASLELERRGLDEVEEGRDIARANENYAQVQLQNAQQADAQFAAVRWELLELDSLQSWTSASAVDSSDQVKLSINGFSYYSSNKKKRNEVLYDLARQRTRLSHDVEAARLQREINSAQAYGAVARQQVQQAQARIEVAEQRVFIAGLQAEHAQENLAFIEGREFGSALWYNLAREARRLSRRYLDMAIEVAVMMELAYKAETGRDLRKINYDYGLDSLNGLLGAEALLNDIDYFSLDYVRTRAKKVPVKQTLSLADRYPMAMEQLMASGSSFFETTMDQFDQSYPGLYLQKVKQVELVFVGLNGSEGVHGTLRNIGLSKYRSKAGAIEDQVYPADVMPLSEYQVKQDAIVFQLDSRELRLFENNGIATMWQLDLPLRSNTFDLRQILDVHLVIYYDAFFDAALETQVIAGLPAMGEASRGLSLRLYAPDELFYLRNQGTAELEVSTDLFPANQENHRLKHFILRALGEQDTIEGLTVTMRSAQHDTSHSFTLDAEGLVDGDDFDLLLDESLYDAWTFSITAEDNPDLVQEGKLDLAGLDDLSVFIEYDFEYRQ